MPTVTSQDIERLDPEVRAQVETATFKSKGRNLRLVRVPKVVAHVEGLNQTIREGIAYSFEPHGSLEVYAGQDEAPTGLLGADMQPQVEDALTWLRRHPSLNGYFWEEGREPDRPLPTEEDVFATVLDAVAALDSEPIATILANEKATHNRPLVLKACERALEKLGAPLEANYGSLAGRVAADYADAAPAAGPQAPTPAESAAAFAQPSEAGTDDPMALQAQRAREAEEVAQARKAQEERDDAAAADPAIAGAGVAGPAAGPLGVGFVPDQGVDVDPALLKPEGEDADLSGEPPVEAASADMGAAIRAAGDDEGPGLTG